MKFPVKVTKGKDTADVVHAVDLQGWLNAGWSVFDGKDQEPTKKEPTKKDILIAQAKELNIELDGKETIQVLEELILESQKQD